MRTLERLLLALGLALAFSGPAVAQLETATVIGTLADAQNAVMPGGTITARNVDTGFTRTGTTDADGRYRLAALPPGKYEFSAELQGFTTAVRSGVTLTVGSEPSSTFSSSSAISPSRSR